MRDRQEKERVVRNEVAFRAVNENIELGREPEDETLIRFVCECGDAGCTRLIELTAAEYAEVRGDGRRFAVFGDHVFPDVERVVAEHGRYTVIEKIDESAVTAEETDPRG